jgi:hypothetical protein
MLSMLSLSYEHDPSFTRKKSMCLWNFLLIFSPLVDLCLLDVLDVSFSSILPELPSLNEDRSDKYLFSCTSYKTIDDRNSQSIKM